jgi:hypothetical protein
MVILDTRMFSNDLNVLHKINFMVHVQTLKILGLRDDDVEVGAITGRFLTGIVQKIHISAETGNML